MDKAKNLRDFFAASENQTTRERIFFNRLSFDLKIAAARSGYHLHIYEPDVDRDGFDIVAEDGDHTNWYQTKAVLSSAGTSLWDILAGLLWPNVSSAESYEFAPVEAGRGGGVILIEIDDETASGQVVYSYTDFDILIAIAEGFLKERPWSGPGRHAKPAREEARDTIERLRQAGRGEKVSIAKKLFIRVEDADALLGVMGLQSENGYGMFATRQAYGKVQIEKNGQSAASAPLDETSVLHYNMELLVASQPKQPPVTKVTLFDPFDWVRPKLT